MRPEIAAKIAEGRTLRPVPAPKRKHAYRRQRNPLPATAKSLSEAERMRVWLTGIEDIMPRPVQSCCLHILSVSHFLMAEVVTLTEEERENINRTLQELLASNGTPRYVYTRGVR